MTEKDAARLPPVAILAGGLASRLGPIAARRPKSLVEVAGEPFIAHQLRQLAGEGVTKAVLCLGHFGDQIAAFVGDGGRFGLEVGYSFDGAAPLGTGGALRRALPQLGESFFVLYGDSFLPIAFAPVADAFRSAGRPALMTVLRNAGRWDRSNASFVQGLVHYDKRAPRPEMEHIDYGLAVLNAAALDGWPEDRGFDLADVYHHLSLAGVLAGFEVFSRFYEIGSPAGLAETEAFLRAARQA